MYKNIHKYISCHLAVPNFLGRPGLDNFRPPDGISCLEVDCLGKLRRGRLSKRVLHSKMWLLDVTISSQNLQILHTGPLNCDRISRNSGRRRTEEHLFGCLTQSGKLSVLAMMRNTQGLWKLEPVSDVEPQRLRSRCGGVLLAASTAG